MKREDVKQSLIDHKLGFEILMERLKSALGVNSDAQLSKILNISTSNLSNRKKAGSVPFDLIIPLCISRNISTDWIFRGIGSPFMNDEQLDTAPIATVDPLLLGAVMRDLETAFAGDALDAKSRTAHAMNLALLSAGIYNMVAFEKNEKRRGTLIKEEAKGFARAAVLFEQRSSIDET